MGVAALGPPPPAPQPSPHGPPPRPPPAGPPPGEALPLPLADVTGGDDGADSEATPPRAAHRAPRFSAQRAEPPGQRWEEVYASSLAEADHGGTRGGDTWLDERRLFLGRGPSRSSALVAPQLSRHVASRLSEESAVLRERRRGREEKELARSSKPSAGQGDSALRARGRGRGRM